MSGRCEAAQAHCHMGDLGRVGPPVVSEEKQIAGLIWEIHRCARVELHIGVTRQAQANELVQQAREARAVDAEGAAAAPQIGHADETQRIRHNLRSPSGFVRWQSAKAVADWLPAPKPRTHR